MKFNIILLVVCTVAVRVECETCNRVTDCDNIGCDISTVLACSQGECTCVYPSATCVTGACSSHTHCGGPGCQCRNSQDTWHCYHGHCHCGYSGKAIGK